MLPIHSSLPLAAAQSGSEVDTANEQKLKKTAGDFESILLASMWKSMKQSFSDPNEQDSDAASGTLNDWGIEVMSGAVGKAGGLGIGNMIVKYLEKHSGSGAAAADDKKPSAANVFGKSADNNQ
jgi:Rod binding domain-containing protein